MATQPAVLKNDERRVFDITAATQFMRDIGFSAITEWGVRRLISAGKLKARKVGKQWYTSRESVLELIDSLEHRAGTRKTAEARK